MLKSLKSFKNSCIVDCATFFSLKQVRSGKFASDIGFKTRISLGDVLEILKLWRCEKPFRARYALITFFLPRLSGSAVVGILYLNLPFRG